MKEHRREEAILLTLTRNAENRSEKESRESSRREFSDVVSRSSGIASFRSIVIRNAESQSGFVVVEHRTRRVDNALSGHAFES